jgi:putative intracellular protease/amidase
MSIAVRRLSNLSVRDLNKRCALIIIADGFEEIETVTVLTLMRQAGLCIKSVGLTSGPVSGAHGVWVVPDLTLADVERLTDVTSISAVILPDGKQSLARLEADPRVHRLLRQVVAQRGQIATGRNGLKVVRAATVWDKVSAEVDNAFRVPVLVREWKQSAEKFVQELTRRLK